MWGTVILLLLLYYGHNPVFGYGDVVAGVKKNNVLFTHPSDSSNMIRCFGLRVTVWAKGWDVFFLPKATAPPHTYFLDFHRNLSHRGRLRIVVPSVVGRYLRPAADTSTPTQSKYASEVYSIIFSPQKHRYRVTAPVRLKLFCHVFEFHRPR